MALIFTCSMTTNDGNNNVLPRLGLRISYWTRQCEKKAAGEPFKEVVHARRKVRPNLMSQ